MYDDIIGMKHLDTKNRNITTKQYNTELRKFVHNYSENKIKIPMKRYVACIHADEVNFVLPNVLVQLILQYGMMQCVKSETTKFISRDCNTLCLRNVCHYHASVKKLDLEYCLASVELIKLK